jgi:LysR family hydrogen peroxide-inducible transcriptional activator
VVAQAQRVLEESASIKDIASAGRDQLKAPLYVGAIFTIGPYLFPHFIPALQKAVPQMPLVVEEGFTATLRQRLRKGELDVIIVALPFTEPDVVTQPLFSEPFVVLMPEDHPLGKKKTIRPVDLDDENVLLLGEGHCFGDQVREALPNLNKHLDETQSQIRTHSEGSSLETLRHMVASRLGITILPQSAAIGAGYKDGLLITRPFADPVPCRTVALAWRASFPRHKAVDALREAIKMNSLPSCPPCAA